MTWKNKGNYRPYPGWALRGPWVKKTCASCGVDLAGATPRAFAREIMCFACPPMEDEPFVSDPQCNIPKEES